jgi:hypothetical protein
MVSACSVRSKVPDIDFISYYWVFSENTSESGKNVVEIKTAGNIFSGNCRNTMAKPSGGTLVF